MAVLRVRDPKVSCASLDFASLSCNLRERMLRVNGESLADEIRSARDKAAISQVELAQKLGVSPRTVQGWEAGRIPQPKHRRAVIEFVKAAA